MYGLEESYDHTFVTKSLYRHIFRSKPSRIYYKSMGFANSIHKQLTTKNPLQENGLCSFSLNN